MFHVSKVLLRAPDQHYLLLLRSEHPTFPNDPDLPGGTVEDGEEPIVAAVREVEEETGIDISEKPLTHLYTGTKYSTHGTEYSLYLCDVDTQPEVMISWEHASYEWVTLEQLIDQSGSATDTYMHMVHDTLLKKLQ